MDNYIFNNIFNYLNRNNEDSSHEYIDSDSESDIDEDLHGYRNFDYFDESDYEPEELSMPGLLYNMITTLLNDIILYITILIKYHNSTIIDTIFSITELIIARIYCVPC